MEGPARPDRGAARDLVAAVREMLAHDHEPSPRRRPSASASAAFRAAGAPRSRPTSCCNRRDAAGSLRRGHPRPRLCHHRPGPGRGDAAPDFTVPVVQAHMAGGAEPARYCYLGEVFRKQDHGGARGPANICRSASRFSTAMRPRPMPRFSRCSRRLLAPLGCGAMGDIGILLAAVAGLDHHRGARRRLLRHVWRPRGSARCWTGLPAAPGAGGRARCWTCRGPERADRPGSGRPAHPEEMPNAPVSRPATAATRWNITTA
jgi:hypothetical protein